MLFLICDLDIWELACVDLPSQEKTFRLMKERDFRTLSPPVQFIVHFVMISMNGGCVRKDKVSTSRLQLVPTSLKPHRVLPVSRAMVCNFGVLNMQLPPADPFCLLSLSGHICHASSRAIGICGDTLF